MKNVSYFLFAASFVLLLLSLTAFFYSTKVLEKRSFYASVNITKNEIGFDLNSSSLTFGKVNLGGSVTRSVKIDNNFDFPIFVYVSSRGAISSLLFYDKKIKIEADSSVSIPFYVQTSNDSAVGFYDGYVEIRTRGR